MIAFGSRSCAASGAMAVGAAGATGVLRASTGAAAGGFGAGRLYHHAAAAKAASSVAAAAHQRQRGRVGTTMLAARPRSVDGPAAPAAAGVDPVPGSSAGKALQRSKTSSNTA